MSMEHWVKKKKEEEEGRRSREPVPPSAGRRRSQHLRQGLRRPIPLQMLGGLEAILFLRPSRPNTLLQNQCLGLPFLFLDESEDALVNGSLGKLSKLSIIDLLLKTLLYLLKASLSPCLRLNASGLVFLDKLTRVRSLNLELVSDFNAHNDSVFKWGAKFASNLESVTFLYAASFSKKMKSEGEEEIENAITHEELLCRVNLAINCLKEAVLLLGILSVLTAQNLSLQSISITDSNNKGVKLCLGGEKLVPWIDAYLVKAIMRVGYVPVLRLPMYRYVMKRVTIVHFNLHGGDDSEAETAMSDAFAEEQGVFSEAMVQILENHKDSAMFQN